MSRPKQIGSRLYVRYEPRAYRTRGLFIGTNFIQRDGDPLELRLPVGPR